MKIRSPKTTSAEIGELRARLAESDETLRAIRAGEVDAVVTAGKAGLQVFTLQGADHGYRALIESMNEGALTLTADKTIIYANACFARMVRYPLEQVIGSSFRRYLSVADAAALRPHMKQAARSGSKTSVLLRAADGLLRPVQISVRELAKNPSAGVIIGMVVTDMTEARHNEERLRALTNRVVKVQEAERGRVALELHDHITQLLCGIAFRCQALVAKLSGRDLAAKAEAVKLHKLLAAAAEEVERISRNLRPSLLDQLGLDAVFHETGKEFSKRTGVPVTVVGEPPSMRLPPDTELALYRILQEALQNVEKHARARHVAVGLIRSGTAVRLTIRDDGIGFAAERPPATKKQKRGLGLLGMRERAAYVNGTLTITSAPRAGTEIEVCIPLPRA